MHFDPNAAKPGFAQWDTNDLIRIAFLEPTYIDEAKELAKQELARRGLHEVDSQHIERVRIELEGREAALKQADLESSYNANRILDNLREGILVVALWGAALFAPDYLADLKVSDWRIWFFGAIWVVVAYRSIQDARQGKRWRLYAVVVVPLALLIVSELLAWLVL